MTQQTVDNPPVAATESGGPKTAPPLYGEDRKFEFEVVPGFFLQDGGDKNVDFEADLVSHPQLTLRAMQGRMRTRMERS